MTITEFLLAQIEADEAQAQAMWDEKVRRRTVGLSVSYNFPTPDRTLAECAAKRRIVELHTAYPYPQHMTYGTITACEMCGSVDDSPVEWPCETLTSLASVYAGHPDYDKAWTV